MGRYYKMAEKDPVLGVLQTYMSNAFNSLSRAVIIHFVKESISALLPWAAWMLSSSAVLGCGPGLNLRCTARGPPRAAALCLWASSRASEAVTRAPAL